MRKRKKNRTVKNEKNPFAILKKIICCFSLIFVFSLFFETGEVRCAVSEADYVPWSGDWWPTRHGGLVTGRLYRGHPAPLEKYDYVTVGTYDGPATRFGMEYHYNPAALSWEGLCFCWAAASILEPEPTSEGVYKNVPFRIGDKKGLLAAIYYGTLFNEYPIDTPADFHRILEDFIADQKMPIIIDLGTHGESWNYPVFKYKTEYTQQDNIRHHTTTIYYASDDVSPDFVGTFVVENVSEYYFMLDENGNITESGWEGESAEFPPLVAREPLETIPLNPGLDMEQLRLILNAKDDPYEDNEDFESAALLSSGHHMLMASDPDYFKVSLKKGDKISIRTAPDPQTTEAGLNTYLRTYTPEKNLIQETPGEQLVEAGKDGDYFFQIVSAERSNDPFYQLFFQEHLSHSAIYPLHPTGQWNSGIALLTPDKNPSAEEKIILSIVDKDGVPVRSYYDISLASHLLGMAGTSFDLFPMTGNEYVRIESDVSFLGLQASFAGRSLLMGSNFIPTDQASATLFFPRSDRTGGWETYLGMINTGNQTEEVVRQSYSRDGLLLASDTVELAPGQKMEEYTAYMDIMVQDAATMTAAATSGKKCLTAYTTFFSPSFSANGRDLTPLSAEGAAELAVPHIISDENWWTDMAVMNIGENETRVTFSAYDGEGALINVSEQMIKAKGNFKGQIAKIFPDANAGDIASVKIVSQDEQPLNSVLLYGTNNNLRLAAIPVGSASATSLYLPHMACMAPWWTSVGVMNAGNAETVISLSLFDEKGNVLGSINKELKANQQLSGTIKELFDEDAVQTARYMKVESLIDQPIAGIYLMGADDNRRVMGGEMREMGN